MNLIKPKNLIQDSHLRLLPFENENQREEIVTNRTQVEMIFNAVKEIQMKSSDTLLRKVDGERIKYNPLNRSLIYREEENVLTDHSFSQLCNRLNIPYRYILKCIEGKQLSLARDNVNLWLELDNRNMLIREYDGFVRGILSDKYTAFDTDEMLDAINDVIDLNSFDVKGNFISPERFHLRLAEKSHLNIKGEDLFAGLQIDSSDVGRNSVNVQFFLYKQVCTNGLVIPKEKFTLFRQRHVGITIQKMREEFEEGIRRYLPLVAEIKEMVENAREDVIEVDRDVLVAEIKNKIALSDEKAEKVIDIMIDKYEPTKWGVINAITEVAQDFTLETRLTIEKLAGRMLMVA